MGSERVFTITVEGSASGDVDKSTTLPPASATATRRPEEETATEVTGAALGSITTPELTGSEVGESVSRYACEPPAVNASTVEERRGMCLRMEAPCFSAR